MTDSYSNGHDADRNDSDRYGDQAKPETTQEQGERESATPGQSFPFEQVRTAVFRFAGLGTELAAYALVFAGIGYAIDSFRGHEKAYVTAGATLVGFSYGMFRFVKQVQRGPR